MGDTEFYSDLNRVDDFADLASPKAYTPVPADWWVGTSDIVGSTKAVDEGLYKTVNMIGAAVISAQINAHDGAAFPYIFGGDGAGFAIPPHWKDATAQALAAVQLWATDEFGMELRIGLTPVTDIRAIGLEVAVARFRASGDVDYAMFAGGGLSWAEARMKDGAGAIAPAVPGTQPDLTGLSCRWSHMPSRKGTILSVVMQPSRDAPGARFAEVARDVAQIASELERGGHPAQAKGPGSDWPPVGATLEAHAQRGTSALGPARRKALFESFIAWALIRTGLKIGGFDARHYQNTVGQNADFRKFEDGLKMTLDCDVDTEARLRDVLERAQDAGVLHFGLHRQDEAMMTCIVPSILRDDHVHFIDGAAGGYTAAARQIKARLKNL